VNNQKLKSWPEFVAICRASPEKPLTVLLDREGKQVSVTLVPRRVAPYQIGLSGMSSAIWAVRKGTLAEQLGLAKGDRIASVNETPVASWMRFVETLGQTKESPVRIGLEHDQTTRTVSLESATDALKARFLEGVASRQSLVMAEVVEGSPAAKAGLKPGDRILTLDGRKLRTWDEFAALVRGSEGKPVALTWQREGKRFGPVLIRPVANEKAAYGEVGLEAMKDRVLRKYGFWKSCTVGTHKAVLAVVRLYYTLVGFASGTISPRHVGSIILIAQASYYSALEGLGTLLYFLGIVGINLAIINLFPIPILDGGHLLFLLFEKIKGSPVKERTMAIAQYAGLVVLLGLVLYAVRNDILRIFGSS
jgi:regulator of sigma E protease